MMVGFMSINQGEIWLVEFFPNVGQEIGKIRPAIVINDDKAGKLNLRTIVPITDWKDNYKYFPWMIEINPDNINNLSKKSAIDCFQVKNYSTSRFIKQIGEISNNLIFEIHQTVVKTLNSQYSLNLN